MPLEVGHLEIERGPFAEQLRARARALLERDDEDETAHAASLLDSAWASRSPSSCAEPGPSRAQIASGARSFRLTTVVGRPWRRSAAVAFSTEARSA